MSEPFSVHVRQPFKHLERYLSCIRFIYVPRLVHILLQVTKRKVFHGDVKTRGVVIPPKEFDKTL